MNISHALSETVSHGGFFAVVVGGDSRGWQPVAHCYADGYQDLIDVTVARFQITDRRIGASLVQFSHASRLWSPVLACALGHGVLPDLGGLQRGHTDAALRLPEPVGVSIGPGDPSPNLLYSIVVGEHLDSLAAGLKVKVAAGLLYGNIASALVEASRAYVTVRPDLRSKTVRLTRSLLQTGKLAGTGEITGGDLAFRRHSCCLYYRTPGAGKCRDCGLRRKA